MVCMSLLPILKREKQTQLCESEAILVYIMNSSEYHGYVVRLHIKKEKKEGRKWEGCQIVLQPNQQNREENSKRQKEGQKSPLWDRQKRLTNGNSKFVPIHNYSECKRINFIKPKTQSSWVDLETAKVHYMLCANTGCRFEDTQIKEMTEHLFHINGNQRKEGWPH